MKVGDHVEWDIKMGDLHLSTRRGVVVATEHWHLVVKIDQTPEERYATPFALMGMGDVRKIDNDI